jgi:sortase (surface protein transpeptidase)
MSLRIPAIHVDAPIDAVGVAADHSIAVPPLDKSNLAAWYDGSVHPGEQGTAVILGHIDSAATGPSVFYHLSSLRPGDRVTVTVPKLGRVVYKVDGRREYHKTTIPYAQVFGPVDYAALRLITCGGAFDYQTGHYVDNVVVYASLVSG